MTIYRPRPVHEGPLRSCVIAGRELSWTNCTPASFAMAIERSTLGRIHLTACSVRDKTGDVSGGTTLDQNAYVSQVLYGIQTDVHNGNNVADPTWIARQLQSGRPIVLQGNAGALVATSHRSTGGRVNHAVYVNETRGGTAGHPAEALVYDPAADGRSVSWGKAAISPQWWPWSLVLAFAAALRPASPDGGVTGDVLGPGRMYVAVFPDTEPWFISRHGGLKTSPFPDHLKGKSGATLVARRLRAGPGLQYAPIASNPTLHVGQEFVAYQWVNGETVGGRERWYGSQRGDYWISAAGITGEGGT